MVLNINNYVKNHCFFKQSLLVVIITVIKVTCNLVAVKGRKYFYRGPRLHSLYMYIEKLHKHYLSTYTH